MDSRNPGERRIIWYTEDSYYIDPSGNQVSAIEVVPGESAPVGGETDLPGLYPVLFMNFSPDNTKISKLLLVQIKGDDGEPFLLRFSDIPVR